MSYPLVFPRALAAGEEGLATLTRPTPSLWVLRMHNGIDNRLTTKMCNEVLAPALDHVEREWRSIWSTAKLNKAGIKEGTEGAFVITGTGEKFFSNGLDYHNSLRQPGFHTGVLNPIFVRLLSFPIPTVAALNGHTFAAGFLLALACDYRVMTSGKAWACFNEIHFGAPFPPAFSAIMGAKIGNAHPDLIRQAVLEGHRFTPAELLNAGLIDASVDGGSGKVLEKACEIATSKAPNARGGALGLIRKGIYKHALEACTDETRTVMPDEDNMYARARL